MAHDKRIERISTVLETVVLPLNQSCMAEGERFELSEQDFPLNCFQDSRIKPLCQPSKKVGFTVTNLQNPLSVCSEPFNEHVMLIVPLAVSVHIFSSPSSCYLLTERFSLPRYHIVYTIIRDISYNNKVSDRLSIKFNDIDKSFSFKNSKCAYKTQTESN